MPVKIGLIDVLPLVETVRVRGHDIDVQGIDIPDFGKLLMQFSEIRDMIADKKFSPENLLKLSDEIVTKFIAAGLRDLGDEKAEANIAKLSFGEKTSLASAVYRVSMPDGADPLFDLLEIALGTVASKARQPAETAKPNSGKLRGMRSPQPSAGSSRMATN